jgi:hypothetical protein
MEPFTAITFLPMAAPEPLIDDPVGVDPAALARFDTLSSRMGLIAEAVNAFASPAIQERAFHELVTLINPGDYEDPDEAPDYHAEGVYCGEPAHCTPPYAGALPGTPYPARAVTELARISSWIRSPCAPVAWRASLAGGPTADAALAMLEAGAIALEKVRRAKRALEDTGFFAADQVGDDIAARIIELGTALQLRRDSGQVDDRKQAH